MATCPKCGNFYLGSECKFCKNDPEVIRKQREAEEKRAKYNAAKDSFLVTTTFQFEGYAIEQYKGIVTGSAALGTGILSEFKAGFSDLFGVQSAAFSDKLEEAKNAALSKAVDNAIDLGANALIGVNIAYQTFGNNMIAAVVSGTAVIVKK